MRRRSVRTLALLGLISLGASTAQAAVGSSPEPLTCGFAVRLEVVSQGTHHTAVGFPPFVLDPANPAIYFTKSIALTNQLKFHVAGTFDGEPCDTWEDKTLQAWTYDVATYEPDREPMRQTNVFEGRRQLDWEGENGYDCPVLDVWRWHCVSDRTAFATWSDPECGDLYPPDVQPTETRTVDFLRRQYRSVQDEPPFWGGWTSQNSTVYDFGFTGLLGRTNTLEMRLSRRLALSDFLTQAQAVFETIPWPDWTNSNPYLPAARGGGANIVSVNLEKDEATFSASISRLKYRLAVRGPRGERGKVEWVERFTPAGGGTVLETPFEEEITFNGEEQFLSGTGGAQGKIVEPPPLPGQIDVVLLTQWACADNPCVASDRPGEGATSLRNAPLEIGLGHNAYGEPAGSLFLPPLNTDEVLATPGELRAFVNRGVEVLRLPSGAVRQVRTPTQLVDLVPTSPHGYEVRFYAGPGSDVEHGYYVPPGAPVRVWSIENPEGNRRQLRVTRPGPAGVTTSLLEWDAASGGWRLDTAGLRKELLVTRSDPSFRSEYYAISNPDNTVVYCHERWWQRWAGGRERILLEAIGDEGFSVWSYYDADADQLPANDVRIGKLKSFERFDGYWETYAYDGWGRLTERVQQFLDQPFGSAPNENRQTLLDYRPVTAQDDGKRMTNLARTVVETLLGKEVGRRYRVVLPLENRGHQSPTPGAAYSTGLRPVSYWRTYAPAGFDGVVEMVRAADATITLTEMPIPRSAQSVTFSFARGQPNGDRTAVVAGTKTSATYDARGRLSSRVQVDVPSGTVLASELYTYDGPPGDYRILWHDGTQAHFSGCCGLQRVIEPDGTVVTFTYDAIQRPLTVARAGIIYSNVYDAADRVLAVVRFGTDQSRLTLRQATYDLAGRQTSLTDAAGHVTQITEAFSGRQHFRTTTYPDASTRLEISASDGSPLYHLAPDLRVRYAHGLERTADPGDPSRMGSERRFQREIRLHADNSDSAEVTTTYFDLVGRPFKTCYADGSCHVSFYNPYGQRIRTVDPDNVTNVFGYNVRGELEYAGVDLDADGRGTQSSPDRLRRLVRDVANGRQRAQLFFWEQDGNAHSTLAWSWEIAPAGTFARLRWFDLTWEGTLGYSSAGEAWASVTAPDGQSFLSQFQHGRLVHRRTLAASETLDELAFTYDAHGRLASVTDPRAGTATLTYNAADQIMAVTLPSPDGISPALTTHYEYDNRGRVARVLLPDGGTQTYEYHPNGQLRRTGGTRLYTTMYDYDAQGRLTTLTTWRDLTKSATSSATTTWAYDPQRGWPASKTYPGGRRVSYTHSPGGRLLTRTWARGLTTLYGYNAAGELAAITYADTVTPATRLTYDRAGRPTTFLQPFAHTISRLYNSPGQMLSETLDSLVVSNRYDAWRRLTNIALFPAALLSAPPLQTAGYGYDDASRLQHVRQVQDRVTYSYLPGSDLLQHTLIHHADTPVLHTSRQYDRLNRLLTLGSQSLGQPAQSFAYLHNAAHQRIAVTNADGSYWNYAYDDLGHLTVGRKYWPDTTPVAGQQFEYLYDHLGNRREVRMGGDADGANLRRAGYAPTTLNQYAFRAVPGAVDVLGTAPASATVTVNGQAASRHDDYYHATVRFDNSLGPGVVPITVTATDGGVPTTTSGTVLVGRGFEVLTHDADGNLTNSSLWAYRWDGENRLIAMTSRPEVPVSHRLALRFDYDALGRRVAKSVSNWVNGAWQVVADQRFAYAGWNLQAVLTPDGQPQLTFTWGQDLSGTLQGAGGIGGLLALTVPEGAHAGTYFYAYDGRGNVVGLVNAASGEWAARYEYGPFHELLRATGPLARVNPFLSATKYHDWETGLSYYGYRYYDSGLGRWLNRDPVGEWGGINLYAYVGNDPINVVDPYGLLSWSDFNPLLIFDTEAWGALLHSAAVGDNPRPLDPNSNRALLNDEGITPGTFQDENGNTLTGSQVAACVGGAVIAGTITAMTDGLGNVGKCKAVCKDFTVGKHAVKQMAERGVTEKMIRTALEKGTRYWDPKNKVFNYILPNGFASGKDLLVGFNPVTGKVTTVIRGTDLTVPRLVPAP